MIAQKKPETGPECGTDARAGKVVSQSEPIEFSRFCPACDRYDQQKPYTIAEERGLFTDPFGITWVCKKPLTCNHSFIFNGRIGFCKYRSAIARAYRHGRIPERYCDSCYIDCQGCPLKGMV